MSGNLHINWTCYSEERVVTLRCSTCRTRRRMLAQFEEWYGWTLTCATCGDRWTDGERHERPFCRGWRERSAATAKQRIRELRARLDRRRKAAGRRKASSTGATVSVSSSGGEK